jgi:hypothetical protein
MRNRAISPLGNPYDIPATGIGKTHGTQNAETSHSKGSAIYPVEGGHNIAPTSCQSTTHPSDVPSRFSIQGRNNP